MMKYVLIGTGLVASLAAIFLFILPIVSVLAFFAGALGVFHAAGLDHP